MIRSNGIRNAALWATAPTCMAIFVMLLATGGAAQTSPERNSSRFGPTAVAVRPRSNINEGWRFMPGEIIGAEKAEFADGKWTRLNLPHTWNIADTQDDAPGYRRGIGWYRKSLNLDARLKGKRLFLYFEGANQVAVVFVNGRLAGVHKGGYTAFSFDITNLIKFEAPGTNVIAVKVDNSINGEIPPASSADFNLYGGIYRNVWLVTTEPVHLTMVDHASPGVYVDTPAVSELSAKVRVRGAISNSTDRVRRIRVVNSVLDAKGTSIATMESTVSVPPGKESDFEQTSESISKPHLWSPDEPYLYNVRTQVFDGPRAVDEIRSPLGFRWFSFDADKGFSLNGQSLKLRGTNRHQDYQGLSNALSDELQIKDLELIKAMGMNCLMLAHYPQAPVVLETADRLGLIVWEEIPVVREISTTEEFSNNCKTMLTEMIRQHYNHPSIIMWGYMNEIFLRPRQEDGYVEKTVALAKALDQLAHKEDMSRVTVMAMNRNSIYDSSGIAEIPQVVAWHMYFGWYYGTFPEFGQFLDDQHRRFPKRKLFVSEYGADSDGRLHSLNPVRGDQTSEWARLYHESYVPQIEARPYLNGSGIWNQFDFGSEARGDARPHLNTKGMCTYDRRPKDVYYYYKALYSREPVLYVATREWATRTGSNPRESQGSGKPRVIQPVEVYANLREVELLVNGNSLGTKPVDETRHLSWDVPFQDGLNVIEARGRSGSKTISDRAEVRFIYQAPVLADPAGQFKELAVNVGSNAQFIDAQGSIWESDQSYSAGGWGYVGGTTAKTAQDIRETTDDPLYQTFRQALKSYRLDVADGQYEIELRFVDQQFSKPGERVFNVAVNGKRVVERLDLAKEYGKLKAAVRTFRVNTEKGQGAEIQFEAVVGEPVLSAIRIRRLP